MKSDRVKKILIIVVILAIIIGAFLLLRKDSKTSKEEPKEAKEINSIILSLKEGYGTQYNGKDLLFEEDKITYDDLSAGNILLTATKYVTDKSIDNAISNAVLDTIEHDYGYTVEKYTPYKGEAIRKAIKEVFGKEWEDKSTTPEMNFGYNFIYIKDHDIYLKGKSNTYIPEQDNYHLVTTVVESKKSKDTIETVIAVAYVLKNGDKYAYSDTPSIKKKIVELDELKEIPEDELDNFEQFVITLKKDGDNFVFESIAKK